MEEAFVKFRIKHHGVNRRICHCVVSVQRRFRGRASRRWFDELKLARKTENKKREAFLRDHQPMSVCFATKVCKISHPKERNWFIFTLNPPPCTSQPITLNPIG